MPAPAPSPALPCIAIAGPTACGKTAGALALAAVVLLAVFFRPPSRGPAAQPEDASALPEGVTP